MSKPQSGQADTISASLDHLLHTPLRRISADRARTVADRVVSGANTSTTVSVAAFNSSI